MAKKVLYISYDGLTDPLGQSQILPYLIGLSEKGHQITIHSSEKKGNFEKNRQLIENKTKASGIHWIYTFYSNEVPIFSTVKQLGEIKKSIRAKTAYKEFDIIHCRSIIPAMIGHAFTKISKAKLVFDIRGFWADEKVDGGLWNMDSFLYKRVYRYFKKKEKWLFKEADCIVTLTEKARDYIAENFQTRSNFGVVPCCVDLEHFHKTNFDEQQLNELKSDLGIKSDAYVLAYVGSLGTRYKLKEMLAFFQELKKLEKEAVFLFISKSDTTQISELSAKLKLDINSIVITSCEYKDVPRYLSIADASIFFIVSSFSGKAVSPTKQAEVIGLGMPTITNSGLGDTDQIIKENEIGVVVDDFEENSLQTAANDLLAFNKEATEVRKVAMNYFSLKGGIERYDQIYNNL